MKVVLYIAASPFVAVWALVEVQQLLFGVFIAPGWFTYEYSLALLSIASGVGKELGEGRYGMAIVGIYLCVYVSILVAMCAGITVVIYWGIGKSVKESIQGTVSKWNKARLRRKNDRNPYLRSLPPR